MTRPLPSRADPWVRDLDLVVPSWRGGDDHRLAPGAFALADRIRPALSRITSKLPEAADDGRDGVRHRQAVVAGWAAQTALLAERRPARLLTIGGDCGVELPSVAHLAAHFRTGLFVVWLDAHGDLNSPASSPSGTAHGMPLRLLLDPGLDDLGRWQCLNPSQVLLAGVRDLDPLEEEFRRRRGIRLIDVPALLCDPGALAEALPRHAAVYLHLDLDVLDPADLPAVAVPTRGGLTPQALTAALAAVHARADVVGIGITEYAPGVDHDPVVLDMVLGGLGLAGGAPAL